MKRNFSILLFSLLLANFHFNAEAQNKDSVVVKAIVKEASDNSQLQSLAHQLVEVIGPRLVGTPQMQQAHDWAVKTYSEWGVTARNEKWGEWRGWERGITHIDLVHPRVRTLEGMQLAWSPSTNGKTITAETIILPDLADSNAFKAWLPAAKGKFLLISMAQTTGRSDYNWQVFATKK